MFSILVLSHGRYDGLKNLLDSIEVAEGLSSELDIQVILGINNDPDELVSDKKSLLDKYDFRIIDLYPEGDRMDLLRNSLWKMSKEYLNPKDYYMWMDDDDTVLANLFTTIETLMDIPALYYQVGERCNYTTQEEGQGVTRLVATRALRTMEYSEVFSTIPHYRASLAHGEIFNVGLSYSMYENPIGVHSCEDVLPSLKYYSIIKSIEGRVVMTSEPCISITPSDRTYSLDEWLSSVARISTSLGFLPESDRLRESERLIKYLIHNVYHRKKYDYGQEWL